MANNHLSDDELRALIYFSIGASSEGNLAGKDVSYKLALAGTVNPDGTLQPIENSGFTNRLNFLYVFRRCCCAVGTVMALSGADVAHAADTATAPKPVWPDNGIAQRMLPGAYNMFVEHDEHGQWHAWVMNGDGEDAQALDFFSGEQIHVKAGLLDDGQQSRDFVDAAGGVHTPEVKGFEFSRGPGGLPGGVSFAGGLLSLEGANCSASFIGVMGGIRDDDPMEVHPKWNRVPIYRTAKRKGDCPNGKLDGGVDTGLDLGDGTFLITERCWVFRLRKSDLSPVGLAPALRIVDKAALQASIDQAKGKNIQDATSYLEKTLNLSFDTANSCKSER